MDFELASDLVLLRDTIRRLVDERLIPVETQDASGAPEAQRFESLQQQVREMGLWHLDVPEDLGGPGLGLLGACVVEEQIARTKAFPLRIRQLFGPFVPPALHLASDEQRARLLQPVLDGRRSVEIASGDLDVDRDDCGLAMSAARDGDRYVLRGVERYLSTGPAPDDVIVFAKTEGGVSCLLLDTRSAGVDLSPDAPTIMGGSLWSLRLDDVSVPIGNRLGEEGDGLAMARRWVVSDRIRSYGARSIGIAARALEMTASYAQQRATFGRPLARRNVIRMMIADSMTEIEMARLLMYQAASRFDRGVDVRDLSSMVKVASTEMATRVVDRAMQVHGGSGLTTELPLEHWFRQLRGARIAAGPSDALRSSLASRLVGSA